MASENLPADIPVDSTDGSLPISDSSPEDSASKEGIAEVMAMLTQQAEEYRHKDAKKLYQKDRKQLEELLETQRAQWGLPTMAEETAHTNDSAVPAFWARVVAEKGFDEFGFLVFRLDYSNQTRWDAWYQAFDDMVEASINASTRRSDVKAELVWEIASDDELNGRVMQDLPMIFQASEKMPPSHDLHVALMIDEAATSSLLDPQPGVPPWVTAVNVYYDFENPLPRDDNYPGFFKVAVTSLIPHFWPLLVNEVPPPEFWSWGLNYENEIFEGFHLTERFEMEKWLGYSYFGLDEEGNELHAKEHDEL